MKSKSAVTIIQSEIASQEALSSKVRSESAMVVTMILRTFIPSGVIMISIVIITSQH